MAKAIKNPIVVRQAKNKKTGAFINKWYYVIVGANGEDMAVSQMYPTRYGAERGRHDVFALIHKWQQSQLTALKQTKPNLPALAPFEGDILPQKDKKAVAVLNNFFESGVMLTKASKPSKKQ